MKASDVNRLIRAEKAVESAFALDQIGHIPKHRRGEWIEAKGLLQAIALENQSQAKEDLRVEDDT